jgi:hypothetical protein
MDHGGPTEFHARGAIDDADPAASNDDSGQPAGQAPPETSMSSPDTGNVTQALS